MRKHDSTVNIEYFCLSARHPLANLPMKTRIWRQILKCTNQWPKLIVVLNKMHLPKVNFQYIQNVYSFHFSLQSNEMKSNLSDFSGNCEDSSRRHSNMTYGFNSQKGWTPILSNVNEKGNFISSRKEGPALSCSIGK